MDRRDFSQGSALMTTGAPIGTLRSFSQPEPSTGRPIWLMGHGQTRQNANLEPMIGSAFEQTRRLSSAFRQLPGGIIIDSGTPESVGPLVRGDVMKMHINGLPHPSAGMAS